VLVEEVTKAATTEDKLKALIVAKLAYFDENRTSSKFLLRARRIPTHPGGIDSEFKALYLEQARLVESILKEGVRRKAIRNLGTEQAAYAISDIIRGVVTQRILGCPNRGPVRMPTLFSILYGKESRCHESSCWSGDSHLRVLCLCPGKGNSNTPAKREHSANVSGQRFAGTATGTRFLCRSQTQSTER